jgi:hypothetical protein
MVVDHRSAACTSVPIFRDLPAIALPVTELLLAIVVCHRVGVGGPALTVQHHHLFYIFIIKIIRIGKIDLGRCGNYRYS